MSENEDASRKKKMRDGFEAVLAENQIRPNTLVRNFIVIATYDDLDESGKWMDITESEGLVSWEGLGLLEYVRQTYIPHEDML